MILLYVEASHGARKGFKEGYKGTTLPRKFNPNKCNRNSLKSIGYSLGLTNEHTETP